jgi:hypothetical protein
VPVDFADVEAFANINTRPDEAIAGRDGPRDQGRN